MYRAAGNLMWLDVMYSPQAGVPTRVSAIKELQMHYFQVPTVFPGTVTVAVAPNENPLDARGSMRRISPEEPLHACLLELAEGIRQGIPDAQTLQAWKRVLLSVSFEFKLLDAEEVRWFEAVRLRERLVVDYSAMARSAVQRIYELQGFRALQERKSGKITNADLAKLYNQHGELANSSEAMTENTVKNAAVVYREALLNPRLKTVILETEELYGKQSPYNSILKLYLFVSKAKGVMEERGLRDPHSVVQGLEWLFRSLLDLLKSKLLHTDDIGKRLITGEGSGGKGLIDLLLLKFVLRGFLLNQWLDKLQGVSVGVKLVMRTVFENHASYRQHIGYPDDLSHDLTWQSGWKPSTAKLFTFMEEFPTLATASPCKQHIHYPVRFVESCQELIYGKEMDNALKQAMRSRRPASEVLEVPSVSEKVQDIEELLKKEDVSLPPVASGGPAGDDAEPRGDGVEDAELIEPMLRKMDAEQVEEVLKFKKRAERRIRAHVRLLVEDTDGNLLSQTQLAEEIKNNVAGTPSDDKLTIFWYDTKTGAEAATYPHLRKPPLRGTHYKTCLSAALNARGNKVLPKDVFVLWDAGKQIEGDLMSAFRLQTEDESGRPTPCFFFE